MLMMQCDSYRFSLMVEVCSTLKVEEIERKL